MTPSLGLIIGLPIGVLITIIGLVIMVACFIGWRTDKIGDLEGYEYGMIASLGALITVGALVTTAISMWPFDMEYHSWKTTSGIVKQKESRLISAGKDAGMNQRFVVTFDNGQQRACDDTRCVTVKVGDRLTIKCKRAYQWGATPGYDCNWVKNEPASS